MSTTDTATDPSEAHSGTPRRAWPVLLLALPAFVAIWSGWVELGRLTGFGPVAPLPGIWDEARINTAITLPIGVETYAAYAMYVWLGMNVSNRARTFARWSAIGSLCLGAAGQVAYHLMAAAGMTHAPWPIVALVACLPVAVLGMGAALAHLVTETPEVSPAETAQEAPDQEPHATIEDADQLPSWTEADIANRAALVNGNDQGDVTDLRKRRPARPRQSNADKAVALREKHPEWTYARIGKQLGVTERTVSRYFRPATETTATDVVESGDIQPDIRPLAA
ncbi:hypothetical protein Kisp02_69220 [Kineosporia sp. NBRC 101731]|nr:hypothetical protein [Kineosporia sp. NBRC 101731]GLY33557.1 hypothetical protein Kisp02_69220 [Kineosporia sp. NBRC 101731]